MNKDLELFKRNLEEMEATIEGVRAELEEAKKKYTDIGAIAPGYHADFQLVEKLDGERPVRVYINGKLVAENGKYLGEAYKNDEVFENTVHTDWITSYEDLLLKTEKRESVKVNVVVPSDGGNIIRHVECEELKVEDGCVSIQGREDLSYVCVINRHHLKNKTIAVIKGFGLKEGAIGCTISHDSYNLVLVYKNAKDAFIALKKLEEAGGGMALVCDEEVRNILPLPVAGLMSDKPADEVNRELLAYQEVYYRMMEGNANLLSISLMSLTALPGVIITDEGLADGLSQTFIPVFA